jgi:uncharacterized membrane protein
MTELRFMGDLKFWLGLPLAFAGAYAAWWLYRREARKLKDRLAWGLPLLRAGAVFFILLMLTGPILHHRKVIGQLARVLLLVDASGSMGITDDQMELPRKLLFAQQMGWISAEKFNLKTAIEKLTLAQLVAARAKPELKQPELRAVAKEFADLATVAADELNGVPSDAWSAAVTQTAKMRQELSTAAQTAAAAEDPKRIVAELTAAAQVAARWAKEVGNAFRDHVFRTAAADDAGIREAVRKFDALPRWKRVEALLVSSGAGALNQLAVEHQVELSALSGPKLELLWAPGGDAEAAGKSPQQLALAPTNSSTDLSTAIRTRGEDIKESERAAFVVFTDGQHNLGPSPLETARVLGQRGIPIFAVGVGTQHRPQDVAILQVKGPESVSTDARVQGEIVLKDDMRPGLPFTVRIEHDGSTLWERNLTTEQKPVRSIPFDLSIKDAVQGEMRRQDKSLTFSSVPLSLQVTVSTLEGEKETRNNTASLRLSAITQKPKVLVMDGRPRWEYRYLRNLFERDDRWDLNTLLSAGGGEVKPWVRGNLIGQFPGSREALFSYQLIVFGDIPRNQLKPEELTWIREFVEHGGGGLILVDGRQEQIGVYDPTPLGPLLPVTWKGLPLGERPVQFRLKATGSALSAISLTSDPLENRRLWTSLPGPHWVSPAEALPGSEVLIEATAQDRTVPALVFRRYGAGRVLYAGYDESWRWRYNVADLYHTRFWNQVAKWMMDAPYPVQDKFVSLDAGKAQYQNGEAPDIRVRIRDAQGKLLIQAEAEAIVFRDGKRAATIPLTPDNNFGGTYRARIPNLPEGGYEVRIGVKGLPENELRAKTSFAIGLQGAGELAQIHCDEGLLRQIAAQSGGQFFREEEIKTLVERLKPLSQGRVVESDTALWQSFWWFVPVILLLAIEWFLRKRAGLL